VHPLVLSAAAPAVEAAAEAAAVPADAGSGLQSTLESVLTQLPQWGLKIVGVIAVFVVGRWLATRLAKTLQSSLEKRRFDATLARFFGTMIRMLVMVVVVLACLSLFGIETTSVAAVLGAAAFAVGMALQGSLGNFAAGVMLIIFRPFKVGDVIRAAGEVGKVDVLGLFTTTLDTPDNRRIVVPNTAIFGGNIENLSHHELRRADVPVGVDYSADTKTTRKVLEGAIANVAARVPEAPHQVYLVDLGASSVDWQVRVWCRAADWFTCREQTVAAVKEALDGAGISIPFPQLDVHLDKP